MMLGVVRRKVASDASSALVFKLQVLHVCLDMHSYVHEGRFIFYSKI